MTNKELKKTLSEASRVFILTDANVAALWLPELEHWLGGDDATEIVIEPGEGQKTLQTAQRIWNELLRNGADRHSIMVNLGGGVVTDIGGFAASCYQRGIRFVHVPTTLMGMVDAAIGGKNGVDFAGLKNQIGTFAEPLETLVMPIFLSTLPDRELLSGLAEMLKYGFIADASMLQIAPNNYEQYLLRAGRIKRDIVERDFSEQGCRKVLNFGHTIGHAMESVAHSTANPLTHGEAVAIGMWCALWISVRQCGLAETVLHDYEEKLHWLLSKATLSFSEIDIPAVLRYIGHDKKNRGGEVQWVLLPALGQPQYDAKVPEALVRQCMAECLAMTNKWIG